MTTSDPWDQHTLTKLSEGRSVEIYPDLVRSGVVQCFPGRTFRETFRIFATFSPGQFISFLVALVTDDGLGSCPQLGLKTRGNSGKKETSFRFGFGERNDSGVSLLEFAKTFELVIANSCFLKRDNHLVTFSSTVARTQIDYLLFRKGDRGLCDCKVIPRENITTQHKLLVMNLEIKRDMKRKSLYDRSRIRWGD
ncbi:uncharacterized protein LOC129883995 [Solanum dulcamara]|uniref:uncharacterized protein LOC129883995 n=1 Tax=Solanum dulcamara TaxID=45834 RepID=UPI002485CD14|nr:uncharacterized protein LOC129883995 [Solanum dulcamara]